MDDDGIFIRRTSVDEVVVGTGGAPREGFDTLPIATTLGGIVLIGAGVIAYFVRK